MPKKRPQEVTLILGKLKRHFGKTLENASMEHIYQACALCVRDEIMDRWINARNKVDKWCSICRRNSSLAGHWSTT